MKSPGGSIAPRAAWTLAHARSISLDRPAIVAILNLTPDSFHDRLDPGDPRLAVDHALAAIDEGAAAIELGGESTRPGSTRVPPDEQARRVIPALRAIRAAAPSTPIIIDTTSAVVARRAFAEGADAINDVSAGTEDPAMLDEVARAAAGLVLMHRLRPPELDSYSDRYERPPAYSDVVDEVGGFLRARAIEAMDRGVSRDAIVIDPGLGFGKSVEQNLELIRRTRELIARAEPDRAPPAPIPVLSALSRKSFVGRAGLGRDSQPSERLASTLALSAAHLLAGASVFRVHDVRAHAEALAAAWALARADPRDHPRG